MTLVFFMGLVKSKGFSKKRHNVGLTSKVVIQSAAIIRHELVFKLYKNLVERSQIKSFFYLTTY
mgnify:CR=1 FL=1